MGIFDTIISPIVSIINKVIPDKSAAAAAVAELQKLQLEGGLQEELAKLQSVTVNQSDINKTEAANSSTFVAGWRPMIGWVCALSLAYQYLIKPLVLAGFAIAAQYGHAHPVPVLPGIDDNLWQLMFGMLGMGALRSFDKVKGTATTAIGAK